MLAVSEALSRVVNSLAGIDRCQVVPNFIDFQFFTLPPVPRRQESFTFLCVCNLVRVHKRVDRLIRAFARASAVRPWSRLVIVGEGPDEAALRVLAHQCGVAQSVEFTGALPPAGVRERMWQANAFVLASAFETFGVVLVEALATGIPVISTRSGGAEDIVEPGLGRARRSGRRGRPGQRDGGGGLGIVFRAAPSRSGGGSFQFREGRRGPAGCLRRLSRRSAGRPAVNHEATLMTNREKIVKLARTFKAMCRHPVSLCRVLAHVRRFGHARPRQPEARAR